MKIDNVTMISWRHNDNAYEEQHDK